MELIAKGEAYYAFDSPQEIESQKQDAMVEFNPNWQYNYISRSSMKNSLTLAPEEVKKKLDAGESHVIRLKVPEKEEIQFHDEVRGQVVIHSSNIDDKVLLKSDGMARIVTPKIIHNS